MPFPSGSHRGAVWMKCDFQVHTPRDPNWQGDKLLGGGVESEALRDAWAESLLDAIEHKGLTAIAITDHHDCCFIPYVQKAIKARGCEDRIFLFPGMEITCDDSSQCLVLFDRDTDEATWDRMFGVLPHIQKAAGYLAVAAQAELCGLSVDALVGSLANSKILDGKYIALPNASKEGSHKTILRVGFHSRFADLQTVGFYSDHAISKYGAGDLKIIYGGVKEWGDRRRGLLPTGDNRSPAFADLGINPCWIKLGEPTTEAIRQALLADEARIRYEAPVYPAQRIVGMQVVSTLTGSLQLTFNEGFNAFIGGRGSGKSALLEYIRFGLGRSAIDIRSEPERVREDQLLRSTLKNGSVSLELDRNGVREIWRREGEQSTIRVSVNGVPDETISLDEAQQRFRARAFSQKQLSTLIRTTDEAAEQITGIAAVESLDRRRDLEQEITELKRAIQTRVAGLVEYWTAEGLYESAMKSVIDLQRRIATTKTQMEAEGLDNEQRAILDKAPAYDLANALLPEAESALRADLLQVKTLRSSILSLDITRRAEVDEFLPVRDFYEQVALGQTAINLAFDSIENTILSLIGNEESAASGFAILSDAFQEQHTKASSGQAKLTGLIQESNRLAKELQEAESKQRHQKLRLEKLGNAPEELTTSRLRLTETQKKLKALLESAATEVSTLSSGVLRAKVSSETEPRDFLSAFLSLCEQHNVKDSSSRCMDRVSQIMAGDPATSWEAIAQGALLLLKQQVQTPSGTQTQVDETANKALTSILFPLTSQQAVKIFQSLDATKVGAMLGAAPRDFIEFEYRDESSYVPFTQASPGQQAAALLDLLLRQEAGTLIIDQPEDDLDNKVIMYVVNLLHSSKSGRQLMFSTHNANFVVNGDADKVIALAPGALINGSAASYRVAVEADGAIDTPAVRRVITETVEGGRDAFDLRGRKYQFLT